MYLLENLSNEIKKEIIKSDEADHLVHCKTCDSIYHFDYNDILLSTRGKGYVKCPDCSCIIRLDNQYYTSKITLTHEEIKKFIDIEKIKLRISSDEIINKINNIREYKTKTVKNKMIVCCICSYIDFNKMSKVNIEDFISFAHEYYKLPKKNIKEIIELFCD